MYESPRQPAYAPTPYSYTPNTALNATINLDEEVRLANSPAERDLYDSLAEIYSIIITIDGLEKAYIKDSITEAEYTETCSRLLKQYSSNLSDEGVRKEFVDLETFKRDWNMECPRATERLRIGLPLTLTSPTPSSNAGQSNSSQPSAAQSFHPSTSAVLLATETFITFLDGLKLGLTSKDQLHPLLSEVIQAVNKVTEADFEGRGSIVKWLIRLNGMRAQEELGEGEARECAFEMEQAYGGFKAALGA